MMLIGHLLARTERIGFTGDVINLPLRGPSMIAKAVASLDLMSGGRMTLGLGAGGYWDAIEAYGGRRLTPGQSIGALSEAIDIMRELWDTSTREMVKADGEFYRVVGAKRGPAPAHRVPIWLGGYGPKMIRLIGAKADGWLPSLGMADLSAIADASVRLDAAAVEAGRNPADIRRVVNMDSVVKPGGAGGGRTDAEWVELLTGLAVDLGFSTFLLAGDDMSSYERIANEIVPAVRQAVMASR